jgi:hypothetical protein
MKTDLETVSAAGYGFAFEPSTGSPKDLQGPLPQGGLIAASNSDNPILFIIVLPASQL